MLRCGAPPRTVRTAVLLKQAGEPAPDRRNPRGTRVSMKAMKVELERALAIGLSPFSGHLEAPKAREQAGRWRARTRVQWAIEAGERHRYDVNT